MDYNEYQYLWVPRPTQKIARTMLGFYQQRGYVAQKKKNGTCTLIFARGNEVIFKMRHGPDSNHKLWTPKADHFKFFSGSKNWNVYAAELLHSKVTDGPKDELYIFDQLVRDGQHLTGTTFASRIDHMKAKFAGKPEDDQYRIDTRVTLAMSFRSGFVTLFDNLKDEDEGLVLKDANATLRACLKENANAGWQVKARIAHANYSF